MELTQHCCQCTREELQDTVDSRAAHYAEDILLEGNNSKFSKSAQTLANLLMEQILKEAQKPNG